jgi:glycine/D-amino acid oxidase-like deaminating enzyme
MQGTGASSRALRRLVAVRVEKNDPVTICDTLIIGQGLAGSILAYTLEQLGQRVLILDDGLRSSASKVAAGLINPVTGQRFVKAPDTDAQLAAARTLYTALEQRFGVTLLYPLPMLRLLRNEKEAERCRKRLNDPDYRDYLSAPRDELAGIRPPWGVCEQRHTGYLDTRLLLESLAGHFRRGDRLITDRFDPAALEIHHKGIRWQGISADRIVFCEGYKGMDNPWFEHLPFQPAKGEILSLRIEDPLLPRAILNGGQWLMPRHDGSYRLGASYDRENLDETIGNSARSTLLAALPRLLGRQLAYTIIDQSAGVRPNTLPKTPFTELHPQHHQLAIFNGFGSRGSLLIPWHAQRFANDLSSQ